MKKLLFVLGVIIMCLLFSCKKDHPPPPPPPPIDSFLLHPPPVLDSLQIPFTIGTWWKYQRFDSSYGHSNINQIPKYGPFNIDTSIELVTVIGKTKIFDTAYEIHNNNIINTRIDTVNSFILEFKNITKGTLDTNYATFYDSYFSITPNNSLSISIKVPLVEGTHNGTHLYWEVISVKKDTSINVLNKSFANCIYYHDFYSIGVPDSKDYYHNIFLKSGVGIVHWERELQIGCRACLGPNYQYITRELLDYYIAP